MKITKFLLTTLTCLLLFACNKEQFSPKKANPTNDPLDGNTHLLQDSIDNGKCVVFNDYVRGTRRFTDEQPAPFERKLGTPIEVIEGTIKCITREVEWASEFNEYLNLQPTTEILFPGQLVDIGAGFNSFRPIIAGRDSLVISISLSADSGKSSSNVIKDPSKLGNVRATINDLLNSVAPESTPASINFEISSVKSVEEIDQQLGANVGAYGVKITGAYNFSDKEIKTRQLIKYTQIYYSIEMDLPQSPCDLFNPIPSLETAEELMNGSSPTYISSVKYGRSVYFMIESTENEDKVEKALNVAFNRWGVEAGIDFSREDRAVLEKTTIKAYIIGGSADQAVKVFADKMEGLETFITEDANFSLETPGVPISYTLRFLKDNSVAKSVLASKYSISDCEEIFEEKVLVSNNTVQNPYDGCPIKYHGDNEFGNPAVNISGKIELKIREDKKAVIAKINVHFDEPVPDNHEKDTRARLEDEIIAYELREHDKEIVAILSDPISYIDYTPNSNGNHVIPFSSDFIDQIIIQADGGGDDLPCQGFTEDPDGRAFVRIIFNKLRLGIR